MVQRPTRSAGLFLLIQISVIAGFGYALSYIPISPKTLLWLLFASVVWIGLLGVYVLSSAVDRMVHLLDDISKKINMPPKEESHP
ncbi:MAG: hypothetical protein JJE16_00455 [Nitrospiraceae bacterium]|nr:hypothetical protein [Nitrospiraceae bacterium]